MQAQSKAPPVAAANPAKTPTRQNVPTTAVTAEQGRDISNTQNTQEWFQYARYLGIQAKLDISQPNDPDEQEADRVADKVMRMADGSVGLDNLSSSRTNKLNRACDHCDEDQSIRRSASGAAESNPASARFQVPARHTGQALSSSTRQFFEPRFGQDFSQVRVHADGSAAESARAIRARAYTHQDQIVFGQVNYAPETDSGKQLLAHELSHVLQQSITPTGVSKVQRKAEGSVISGNGDQKIGPVQNRLPYRAELERAFNQDFSDIQVQLGAACGSGQGASATYDGFRDVVAFDQVTPSRIQVAHELVHVAQRRKFGNGADGLASYQSPSEVEARDLAPLAALGQTVSVRTKPSGYTQFDDDVAQRIHEHLHGWISDDETSALRELRFDPDRRGTCSTYQTRFRYSLWGDFIDHASGDTLHQAVALLWPYMTLLERLDTMTGVDDDEAGILQTITNASNADVNDAPRWRIQAYLDELDPEDQYTARRRIWPEDPVGNVAWLLSAGDGWIWDDEGPVATAILSLSPAERAHLWNDYPNSFGMFNEADLDRIHRMCITVGDDGVARMTTDAEALTARMELATEGVATDEEGVLAAIAVAGNRRDELAQIEQAIDTGSAQDGLPLTPDQRAVLGRRRNEIGNVVGLLTPITGTGGTLDENSFLGRVEDDMDAATVDAVMVTAHTSAFERAKQGLLLTKDWTGNVDEETVLRILREVQGDLPLAAGETVETLGEEEMQRRRGVSRVKIRNHLRTDQDLIDAGIWSALGDWLWDDDEVAMAVAITSGDEYEVARLDLVEAYEGIDTDETAILRILRDAGPRVREQLRGVPPVPPDPIIDQISNWVAGTRFETAFEETLQTGAIPMDSAMDEALGGDFDGTNVELVNEILDSLSATDRAQFRRGYLLAHTRDLRTNRVCAPGISLSPVDQAALVRYETLHAQLANEMTDEELDTALVNLLDIPSVEEMAGTDGQGRLDAAAIMLYRQRERLELNAGFILDLLTTTDNTAASAHVEFEDRYNQSIEDGDISPDEFSVLVRLDSVFNDRFREYAETANMVPEIAGTVMAVVVAVVVIAVSKGTAAPSVIAWLSANSGLIGSAAAASAVTQVVTSEALGGDFNEMMGADGARQALSGAINGALAVCGAALAARAATMVGLSGPSLTAAIARAAAESVEVSVAGRAFARGALIGLIDGSLGGVVGELAMTLTDAKTWRHTVWGVLAKAGEAILRGGFLGGSTGAVTGGLLEMAQGLLAQRAMRDVVVEMDTAGSRIHIDYTVNPEGTLDGLTLRFGPNTTGADIAAHVNTIARIRRASSFVTRARDALTGIKKAPVSTVSGDAAQEAAKIPDMIQDRLIQLNGDLSLAERDVLEAEIDLMQANFDYFSRLARSGDLTKGTGRIARLDAPPVNPGEPKYPDPPLGHYYHRRGSSWDLQRLPGYKGTPRTIIRDGEGGWIDIERIGAEGPIEEAMFRSDAGAIRDDAFSPSAEARAEMESIAVLRLEEMDARDFAAREVERLRTSLRLTADDVSSSNIDDTLTRLRTQHAGEPYMLTQIDDLARHRGALADARRELNQASELLGNAAAMDVMQSRGATRLWGNPMPPGRSGEFDFIYVIRDKHGTINEIFVVEAKGASSTLGTRDVAGIAREQGTPAYLSDIATTMNPRDGSEFERVLSLIELRPDGGPKVRYILVQARVDGVGNPLPAVVSEFNLAPLAGVTVP